MHKITRLDSGNEIVSEIILKLLQRHYGITEMSFSIHLCVLYPSDISAYPLHMK